MDEWQDISTAPKDGTKIVARLGFGGGTEEYAVIEWTGHVKWPWKGSTDGSDAMAETVPTHWMPLPPPPSIKEG